MVLCSFTSHTFTCPQDRRHRESCFILFLEREKKISFDGDGGVVSRVRRGVLSLCVVRQMLS